MSSSPRPSRNASHDVRRRAARLGLARTALGIGTTLGVVVACAVTPDQPDDTGGTAGMGGTSGSAGRASTTGGMSGTGTMTGGATGAGRGGTGGAASSSGGMSGAGRGGGSGTAGIPSMMGGASGGAGMPSGGAGASAGGVPPMGGMAGTMPSAGRGGAGAPSGGMGGASGGSGGMPSAGGGGSGSTGDFHPCPTNGDPCKILPLGDSITWGLQYDGAYRVELFTKAVGDNKKITFTGSLSNGPSMVAGQTFPKMNEGHSGWTIDQDAGLIPSPAMNTIPHIVLLHIGTNDIYASSGQATMPDRLGKLVDKIIAAAPDALVVVAKITPLSNASWNATIKTYNDAIPGVIKTRADAGKHVIGADMNTGFHGLSSDGVHPAKEGYDFMGDQWYAVIKDYLP